MPTLLRILLRAGLAPALLDQVEAAAREGGRTAEVLQHTDRDTFAAQLPAAEVLLGGIRPGQAATARRLRWVHQASAGVDGLPLAELAAAGIVLTNARGQHADAVADHSFALLLAMSREIPRFVAAQQARRWQPGELGELAGRRLGVLGLGAIGRAVARRAVAFGMEVWATRSNPAPDPCCARVLGPSRDELLELLASCDDICAILPSTPRTRGLLDAQAFAALRPGARLINVGRGDVLDRQAFAAALASGQLAGAGCDCLPGEPLSEDDPLWSAPNLLITPHVGGAQHDYQARSMVVFLANLRRYCLGQPLANVVDLQAGY